MSIRHSPTKTGTISGGGSLTNLSNMEYETVSQRKRKQPLNECDCKLEIQGLRQEFSRMTELLEKMSDKQDITMENMRQNLTDIKDQMHEIKQSTSSLATEQNVIKSELSKLNSQVGAGETKIQHMETNFVQISNKLIAAEGKLQTLESDLLQKKPIAGSSSLKNEEFFKEIQERNSRTKNLIISGMPEPYDMDSKHRRQNDQQEVVKILNTLIDKCPEPVKILRIGKYNKERNRHIKICFTDSETPRIILNNKTKLSSTLRIFTDQTPMQQELFKETKMELNRRLLAGETNLIIKYIKGIPKVIENNPKN